jgi:tRNA (cmo5U34)-methyltransferase
MSGKDKVMPEGKWQFDQDVANVFDDMLQRSIPNYYEMRALVNALSLEYARTGTTVVDLGCSHGETIADIYRVAGDTVRYVGVEISKPMIERARKRFMEGYPTVDICEMDLRHEYPFAERAGLTLSVLTLMFIPIEYRLNVLQTVRDNLASDGAFILVEKVLGEGSIIDRMMVRQYLKMKRDNGYTEDQIERKRLSLEGVLVPVSAGYNVDMLKQVGFSHIDCFWRSLNFCGFIALP